MVRYNTEREHKVNALTRKFVPGSIIALVGLGYIVLEFVPSIEPPANMRDAEASWGAEQI